MSSSSSHRKSSGSGNKHNSKRKGSSSGTSTGTSSSGGSGDTQYRDNGSQWSAWQWNSKWQCEWRERRGANDEWEYDYRHPEESTPRNLPDSSQDSVSQGPLPDVRPADTNYVLGTYQQQNTAVGSAYNMSTLTRGVDSLQIPSRPLSYDSPASENERPSSMSMVNSAGIPIPRASQGNVYDLEDEEEPPEPYSQLQGSFTLEDSPLPRNYMYSQSGNLQSTSEPRIRADNLGYTSSIDPRPQLQRKNSSSAKSSLFIGPGGPAKNLNKEYKLYAEKDFGFGKIFKILWTEPKGQVKNNNGNTKGTDRLPTKFNEESYSSIRRFVIVNAMKGHCLCLPILTYGRQATKKHGVKAQDHAIIYVQSKPSKKTDKPEVPDEIEGEERLSKKPIRMDPQTPRDQLDKLSRLNYAKIYTVEYNVKVSFIGRIHRKSVDRFSRDYNLTHRPLPEAETQFSEDAEEEEEEGEEW